MRAYSPLPNSVRGFDRSIPDLMGEPSYTAETRTFTLTPTVGIGYFQFWSNGQKFTKHEAQSVVWPNTSGTYYFYFDTDGDLQYILNSNWTQALFVKVAICGLVYWDAVGGVAWGASDEQHGIVMDSESHFRLHMVEGFRWSQGGLITGLIDGNDDYTNIGVGVHHDEDIVIATGVITDTPFMYRLGANGEWKITAEDMKIGYIESGNTYISYNQFDAGEWKLIESTSSTDYIIYFMVKTNFTTSPYRKIVGQTTYASRRDARIGLREDLKAVKLSGLPSTETEFQFAWIAKRNGELEVDGEGNAYVDLRGIQINSLGDA